MTRIWIVRHGQSMLNAAGRLQGWSDAPLTPLGREQAAGRGADFAAAGIEFDAAFCADGMRHRETAAGLLAALGSSLTAQPDARWRELSFGALEGGDGEEFERMIHAQASQADPVTAALDALAAADPLAESPADVAARALPALHEICVAGAEVLVVTSGITIMTVLDALGADLTHLTAGPANLSVSTVLRADATWQVERVAVDAL